MKYYRQITSYDKILSTNYFLWWNIINKVLVMIKYYRQSTCYDEILPTKYLLWWNIIDKLLVMMKYYRQSTCYDKILSTNYLLWWNIIDKVLVTMKYYRQITCYDEILSTNYLLWWNIIDKLLAMMKYYRQITCYDEILSILYILWWNVIDKIRVLTVKYKFTVDAQAFLCPTHTTNSSLHFADPTNCSYFFQCDDISTTPFRKRCPGELLFNAHISVCDWPDHAYCTYYWWNLSTNNKLNIIPRSNECFLRFTAFIVNALYD